MTPIFIQLIRFNLLFNNVINRVQTILPCTLLNFYCMCPLKYIDNFTFPAIAIAILRRIRINSINLVVQDMIIFKSLQESSNNFHLLIQAILLHYFQ